MTYVTVILALTVLILAWVIIGNHAQQQIERLKLRSSDFNNIENMWILMKEDEFNQIEEIAPNIHIYRNTNKEVTEIKVSHPLGARINAKTGCGRENIHKGK